MAFTAQEEVPGALWHALWVDGFGQNCMIGGVMQLHRLLRKAWTALQLSRSVLHHAALALYIRRYERSGEMPSYDFSSPLLLPFHIDAILVS